MKINSEFKSVPLVLTALILYLIFISSAASATSEQGANSSRTYAYIPNDDNVSVIDTSTNTVVATVPVRFAGSGVAVSPDGTNVYMTSNYSVSVIDTSTNTVITIVPVGLRPMGIAITPDGKKLYLAGYGAGSILYADNLVNKSAGVFVIDMTINNVIAYVPVEGIPVEVAVAPDGTKVMWLTKEMVLSL